MCLSRYEIRKNNKMWYFIHTLPSKNLMRGKLLKIIFWTIENLFKWLPSSCPHSNQRPVNSSNDLQHGTTSPLLLDLINCLFFVSWIKKIRPGHATLRSIKGWFFFINFFPFLWQVLKKWKVIWLFTSWP